MQKALAPADNYTEKDYYNLPENIRAELINGQIFHMPAPSRVHQEILMFLSKTIANYIDAKSGQCKIYPAPFAVKLFKDDDKTVVEPDISVICDPNKLTERGCSGAPDWIIEIISPGTSSHDYIRKLELYLDAGVKEYWIADPRTKKIFTYHLNQKDVKVDSYTFQDRIKAGIYDDLWIDFKKLEV